MEPNADKGKPGSCRAAKDNGGEGGLNKNGKQRTSKKEAKYLSVVFFRASLQLMFLSGLTLNKSEKNTSMLCPCVGNRGLRSSIVGRMPPTP